MRKKVKEILENYNRVTFLTGAGISTDSGIPDYRGANGVYMRNAGYKPIQYQEFVQHHHFRQRYWARSFLGYPQMAFAKPNEAHYWITNYASKYPLTRLITQNVDGLHKKIGSDAIEMHGGLDLLACLSCKTKYNRLEFQKQLADMNPKVFEWSQSNPDKIQSDVASSVNPDGDVDVTWDYRDFAYPSCSNCKYGILKPNVVFFGENITDQVKKQTFDAIDECDCLFVIGSSLTVYSAFRLVRRANEQQKFIIILNLGPTRGDRLANIKLNVSCSEWIK
jgi:NAD-dependent deacetylase sirtuin 4